MEAAGVPSAQATSPRTVVRVEKRTACTVAQAAQEQEPLERLAPGPQREPACPSLELVAQELVAQAVVRTVATVACTAVAVVVAEPPLTAPTLAVVAQVLTES